MRAIDFYWFPVYVWATGRRLMRTIYFYWFLSTVWETGPAIISRAATVTPFRVFYRGGWIPAPRFRGAGFSRE